MDDFKERNISNKEQFKDVWQYSLRPRFFYEYIGQKELKDNLQVFIQAALKRKEALDHVLLFGPPGLGKTTLATVIANELGVNLRVTSGPAIEKSGDLAAILTNLEENDVLFIDEIHRLSRNIEEVLYPAMEDFALDIVIGKGAGARSIRIDLPHFTLIGATTKAGSLASPLRDRFGIVSRLELYTVDEIEMILMRAAEILKVDIIKDGAKEIAKRSRGTPRIANRLLKRIRDFAEVNGKSSVDKRMASEALERLDIDVLGLDVNDRKLLLVIKELFDGGPVGVETLAAAVNEETDTIEDVYEPYLMQIGFILRTPRGRMLSENAYKHLARSK